MREIIAEAHVSTIETLLDAIYRRNQRRQNGEDNSKRALKAQWASLRRALRYPLTIYRALSVPPAEVDWTRVGCSWTWDKDAAVVGGALDSPFGGGDDARTLLRATVSADQVDLSVTMWQFLTVYEEEKEVRLLPNTPIVILDIETSAGDPSPLVPIRANSGATPWDDAGVRDEIRHWTSGDSNETAGSLLRI
jgi:hypothetical protein